MDVEFIHDCIECQQNKHNNQKNSKCNDTNFFRKCFVFQLSNINGYKRIYKSTIKTKQNKTHTFM